MPTRTYIYDKSRGRLVECSRSKERNRRTIAKWPYASESMGVHPSQIKEAQTYLADKGVRCDFTKDGRPILTGKRHRKEVARALGFYDRNAGYGDPEPIHYTSDYSRTKSRTGVSERRAEVQKKIRQLEHELGIKS